MLIFFLGGLICGSIMTKSSIRTFEAYKLIDFNFVMHIEGAGLVFLLIFDSNGSNGTFTLPSACPAVEFVLAWPNRKDKDNEYKNNKVLFLIVFFIFF